MNKKPLKTVFIETLLGRMAHSILWRHKPFVVAITGSVGKTTTKDMIATIIKKEKKIYYTKKNHNNEIGVPLTIMGWENDVDSLFAFFALLWHWVRMMIYYEYPEIIVLEMGVDRPGDMDYLMTIAQPDVSVLTTISYAHSAFFKDIAEIRDEKQKIITRMKKNGTAVVNYDDKYAQNIKSKTHNQIIFYGMKEGADFFASDIEVCFHDCRVAGISFKLNYNGKMIPVRLNNIIAKHFIYAALAALAVVDIVGINVVDAISVLANFSSAPGRMRLLDGKNDFTVIDDTYNASPRAMEAAIETLMDVPGKRKIVVLGDMRELGDVSQREHIAIIKKIIRKNVDAAFLVGNEMTKAYAVTSDKTDIIQKCYMNSQDAVEDIVKFMRSGDVVLVKGSRGIFMEKIVKELVSDPTQTL